MASGVRCLERGARLGPTGPVVPARLLGPRAKADYEGVGLHRPAYLYTY